MLFCLRVFLEVQCTWLFAFGPSLRWQCTAVCLGMFLEVLQCTAACRFIFLEVPHQPLYHWGVGGEFGSVRFLVVCFLYKTNPNHVKLLAVEKSGPNPKCHF